MRNFEGGCGSIFNLFREHSEWFQHATTISTSVAVATGIWTICPAFLKQFSIPSCLSCIVLLRLKKDIMFQRDTSTLCMYLFATKPSEVFCRFCFSEHFRQVQSRVQAPYHCCIGKGAYRQLRSRRRKRYSCSNCGCQTRMLITKQNTTEARDRPAHKKKR